MKVLTGDEGWLFLDNDTNNSVSQFIGKIKIVPYEMEKWAIFHEEAEALAASVGAEYAFMIAPSKEAVYSVYHPYRDHEDRAIIPYLERFPQCIYQRDLLIKPDADFPIYSKTDTHWSDWGAYLSIRDLLQRTGRDIPEVPREDFKIKTDHQGDLGNKLVPPVFATNAVHKATYEDYLVYNNQINNRGRVWICENPHAVLDQVCVLYGDSFSQNFIKFLPLWFRRLVYLHTAAIDKSFVLKEKPNLIISEVTERFMLGAPESLKTFDIRKPIAEKINEAPPEKAIFLIEQQRKYWPDFSPDQYASAA